MKVKDSSMPELWPYAPIKDATFSNRENEVKKV